MDYKQEITNMVLVRALHMPQLPNRIQPHLMPP